MSRGLASLRGYQEGGSTGDGILSRLIKFLTARRWHSDRPFSSPAFQEREKEIREFIGPHLDSLNVLREQLIPSKDWTDRREFTRPYIFGTYSGYDVDEGKPLELNLRPYSETRDVTAFGYDEDNPNVGPGLGWVDRREPSTLHIRPSWVMGRDYPKGRFAAGATSDEEDTDPISIPRLPDTPFTQQGRSNGPYLASSLRNVLQHEFVHSLVGSGLDKYSRPFGYEYEGSHYNPQPDLYATVIETLSRMNRPSGVLNPPKSFNEIAEDVYSLFTDPSPGNVYDKSVLEWHPPMKSKPTIEDGFMRNRPDVWVKDRIREYLDHLLSTETFSPLADPEELWDRTRERARRVR